ncbi:alpha/beta hydrolase [Dactylosporangium salmoneum]|uniref:Alpha/beta hydrolase n=1 Tax=Dactylosporangium salmoneum TaxID=53361 RepID=A0ABN3FBK9_9ACTN
METFDAPDGTRLAYHRTGSGHPLICLPGGPMQDSSYLADLPLRRAAVRLDLRGTGDSAAPADPGTYRCDRQVGDVEALRRHLGLDRIDILAHSAGATIAVLYAMRHPGRVARLALITPSPRPVAVEVTDDDRRAVADRRRDEPWFADASAALDRIHAGAATGADRDAIAPFVYGRADFPAIPRNEEAAKAYYGEGAFDPAEVRAGLAAVEAPVLLVAGELDIQLPPHRAAEYAPLFPAGEAAVVPGAAHVPWRDDSERFVVLLEAW